MQKTFRTKKQTREIFERKGHTMDSYKHIVQYYETDKMGITHHSNYIRWMEEARCDFLKKIGWDYARFEEQGIVSPVVDIAGKYKATTTFEDEIFIDVSVQEFKSAKMILHYDMRKGDGTKVFEGTSSHCFLNEKGMPMRMNKAFPEFHQTLLQYKAEE